MYAGCSVTPKRVLVWMIIAAAFFLRVAAIGLFPVNHDEAAWSWQAIGHFDLFFGLPVSCFNGYIPPLYPLAVALTRLLFPSPELALRLPAALAGTAQVALVYALGRRLFPGNSGIYAAALTAVLPWHVLQSRIGVPVVFTPFSAALCVFLLLVAVERRSRLVLMLSSCLTGLAAWYTYQASLVLIPLALGMLYLLRKQLSWMRAGDIALAVLIIFAMGLPVVFMQAAGSIDVFARYAYALHPPGGDQLNAFSLLSNAGLFLRSAFVRSAGAILYGASFRPALFIHPLFLIPFFAGLAAALPWRDRGGRILFFWIIFAAVAGLSGVRYFQPRYFILLTVPMLLMAGRGLEAWAASSRLVLRLSSRALTAGLLGLCCVQIGVYALAGPLDTEECRRNNYGCKQAAEFLRKQSPARPLRVFCDIQMEPVEVYYRSVLTPSARQAAREAVFIDDLEMTSDHPADYYLLWAPGSRPGKEYAYHYTRLLAEKPGLGVAGRIYFPGAGETITILRETHAH